MNGARRGKRALIAVDGVDATAVLAEARAALGSPGRGGISRWDASGVFQDLAVADAEAGAPSARTLLLLYAADLAFRLRWQIRPALAEGRTVIAAPYVETAIAFGRAAGLNAAWLTSLFRFAPRPAERRFVHPRHARATTVKDGFVGFACDRMMIAAGNRTRRQIAKGTVAHLRRTAQRTRARKARS
jgi:hypothetical protein